MDDQMDVETNVEKRNPRQILMNAIVNLYYLPYKPDEYIVVEVGNKPNFRDFSIGRNENQTWYLFNATRESKHNFIYKESSIGQIIDFVSKLSPIRDILLTYNSEEYNLYYSPEDILGCDENINILENIRLQEMPEAKRRQIYF